jgi:hypothetical protein
MKQILLTLACAIFCTLEAMPQDTTLMLGSKRIEIRENNDRLRIRVYENGQEQKLVFEGQYRDGRIYERREKAIHISVPGFHREKSKGAARSFDPHWDGFSIGFAGLASADLRNINDVGPISLRSDASLEYNLQLFGTAIRLGRNSGWGIVTGGGMRWTRYRVDGSVYFLEQDRFTDLQPAPEDMDVTASKLNITAITIPLLLEYQTRRRVFFSIGAEAIVKTISSSKLKYRVARRKEDTEIMDRGMTLRPVSMDIIAQAGIKSIGIYARYAPLSLFETGRGLTAYPVAIGMQFYF